MILYYVVETPLLKPEGRGKYGVKAHRDAVNKRLSKGWQLYGVPMGMNNHLYQTLTYDDAKDTP